MPPWRPYVVAAVPTSFQSSLTGYAARSITSGRELFQRDCASCHGDDAQGRGPMAVARSVWPPDLSAPLIAGRPGGELFWSIRHGVGTMPPATGIGDAAIWSLVDFIRLRAGARIFSPSEMGWSGAARVPGFVARCADGTLVSPGSGRLLRLWVNGGESETVLAQVDGAAERRSVEDAAPLAVAGQRLPAALCHPRRFWSMPMADCDAPLGPTMMLPQNASRPNCRAFDQARSTTLRSITDTMRLPSQRPGYCGMSCRGRQSG